MCGPLAQLLIRLLLNFWYFNSAKYWVNVVNVLFMLRGRYGNVFSLWNWSYQHVANICTNCCTKYVIITLLACDAAKQRIVSVLSVRVFVCLSTCLQSVSLSVHAKPKNTFDQKLRYVSCNLARLDFGNVWPWDSVVGVILALFKYFTLMAPERPAHKSLDTGFNCGLLVQGVWIQRSHCCVRLSVHPSFCNVHTYNQKVAENSTLVYIFATAW